MAVGSTPGKVRPGLGSAGTLLAALLGRPVMPGFPRPDTFVVLGLALVLIVLSALGGSRGFTSLVEGDPGRPRGDVRAVYLTGPSASDPAYMRRIFELVDASV